MKCTALIVVFLFAAAYLFPQQDKLTLEQWDAYFESRIDIQVYEIRKGEKILVEPSPGARKWKAYSGNKMISERKFLLMSGYTSEAEKARIYRASSIPLFLISPLPAAGSILLTIELAQHIDTSDSSDDGSVLLLIPLLGIAFSYLLFREGVVRQVNNYYSYLEAQVIMDNYNEGLLREMKKE